jgi:hemerythrin superfamily protein
MDALELLHEDHAKVKELFEEAEGTENQKEKERIFEEINSELETHARIEETVFYPAMQKHQELKDMVRESLEEHKQIKALLKQIHNLKSGSEKFDSKLQVLIENVTHHAEEEEEAKMFPKIRKICSQEELDKLGTELETAKNKKQRKAS